jgi:hypothetical protein
MTATQDEAAFRQRMAYDGDLGRMLCEHIWDMCNGLRLGDDKFEVVGGEEIPGYEDDDYAVLLRRKSDGQVFEAEIDVSLRAVRRQAATPDLFSEAEGGAS